MYSEEYPVTIDKLKSAIVPNPLIVTPNMVVMDVIAQMSSIRSICSTSKTADSQVDYLNIEARSSCVMVVENNKLVGILTERDVVRLSVQPRALDKMAVGEVMTSPVVTLRESNCTDFFFVINLLQQYHIRHLPIVDAQDHLVGLVTHETIQQIANPVNLLKLRSVAEIMTREVIYATSNVTVAEVASLMTEHRVSSIVLVQERKINEQESLKIPIGILTERDIVQFQALNLNLKTYQAEAVMSTPIFTVSPEDSLLAVQQTMKQRFINRVVVIGTQGELLGIITQTSLLQALNPLELYKLTQILEGKVLQLENESAKLAAIVESSRDAIISQTLDGMILSWNRSAEKLFGYSAQEIIGKHISILIPLEFQYEENLILQKIIQGENINTYESKRHIKNGTLIDIELTVSPIWGDVNSVIGVSKIARDISERKQNEIILQQTNEELLRATRLKDEFLASMSHELRTPLNAILGLSEVLEERVLGLVNKEQIKALQTIRDSGRHLLALINDILDVAKIESGEIKLALISTSIKDLCQSSIVFIKQQALQKNIQLNFKIQDNLPKVLIDELRMRQVLINLLTNAVKFTPENGKITLEVSQISYISEQNFLRIAVIDTGIGISRKNIKKLFKPFIQIDNALNREQTGTGLGLALVKRIVELHGGKVEVTSELNVGSCFTIELPYNVSSPDLIEINTDKEVKIILEDDSASANLANKPTPLILLAEDNPANISTFSCYLKAKGYLIELAKNGQEAIDFTINHRPDLILMDIQMPKVDGLEAIKQIRSNPNRADIPIIALTALAMPGDREHCLEAGANEYLTKPVQMKELVMMIERFLYLKK